MLTSLLHSDIIDINGTDKRISKSMKPVFFRLPLAVKQELDKALYNLRLTQQEVLTNLVLRFLAETKDKEAA